MRLRQRHLRPKSYGANLALEARTITGLADGDEVAAWADTSGSGNSCDSGSVGFRPLYQKASINGVDAVEFTSSRSAGLANGVTSKCFFVVLDLASDVNHGIIGDFGTLASQQATGYNGGSYKFAKTGSESWNATGDYVFSDRVFWNGVDANNGDANPGVAVFDRNSRSAHSYPGSYATLVGKQATSFTNLEGLMGSLIGLATTPSDSLRKKIEKSLAFQYKLRCA